MTKVIVFQPGPRLGKRRAPNGGAQAFADEFEAFLVDSRTRIRGLSPVAPRAVARTAFRGSRGGRDWLATNPADLLCAAMPARWSVPASERALALVLRFNDFLTMTGRQPPHDAAFSEGWTRAAQAVVLKVLLQHRSGRTPLPTRDEPSPPKKA